MSASEKLKALTEQPVKNMFKIGDALPQIVAVVESAEREVGMEADTEEARMRQVPRLRAALTALEEALS